MLTRNLSPRERALFLVVIAAITVSLFYTFIAEPIFMQWKKLNDEIRSKLAYMAKSERLIRRYKVLEEEYINLPRVTGAMETEEKEIARALEAIEAISASSACRIQNVKPRASREIGSYREISFEVTAEGAISELSKFLYEIETSNELLRVKRFTIASKSGHSGVLKGVFLINKIIAN